MIKKIDIFNFRGISHLEIDGFEQVNLLVGKNNSGKSTVLEAIFLNLGAINPNLTHSINSMRFYDKIDDMAFRSFFYNFKIDESIKINMTVKAPKQYRDLEISALYSEPRNGITINLKDVEGSENSALMSAKIKGLESKFRFKTSSKGNYQEFKSNLILDNSGVKIEFPQDYSEKLFGIFLSPRKFFTQDMVNRLEQIKFRKEEGMLIEILKEVEPDLQKLEILANNVIAADIGKNNLIPLYLMGDGIVRLMSIILTIYEHKNGYILIDEIENGFHHKTLDILWRAVFKLAKLTNTQIFATTHSWENIVKFNKVLEQEKFYNTNLFRIEHHHEKNKVINYDRELLDQTINSNWELR